MRPQPKSDIPLLMEQSQLNLFLRYNHTTAKQLSARTSKEQCAEHSANLMIGWTTQQTQFIG